MVLVYGEPAFRTRHANPYNAALYGEIVARGVEVRELSYLGIAFRRPQVVHLHWPDLTFLSGHRRWRICARLVLFYACLAVGKLRGTRLIWTVHNIDSHEVRATPRLRRWSERLLTRNVDALICLSETARDSVYRRYPRLRRVPLAVTPHGHYRDWYARPDRDLARSSLGVGQRIFAVFIGQIRPYKNVEALLSAAASLQDPRLCVGVAGRPSSPALSGEIEQLASIVDARTELGLLSDDAVATWMAAADVVVLPYAMVENSGAAILALSASRPVVVPAVGAMVELQRLIGSQWVMTYDGQFDATVLSQVVSWAAAPRGEQPDLAALDWAGIADATIAVYEAAAGRRPRR